MKEQNKARTKEKQKLKDNKNGAWVRVKDWLGASHGRHRISNRHCIPIIFANGTGDFNSIVVLPNRGP